MIKLFACGTPNVLKVMLMLAETGLDSELCRVNVHAGEQYLPEFLLLNPNNKVPVIIDEDGPDGIPVTVFESGAILYYLAEKTGKFFAGTLAQRSQIMQWLMLQMSGVGPMFGQAVHFFFMAPAGNEYARDRYLTEVKRLYDVIESRLTNSPWLGGSQYSIADMAMVPWIAKFHLYKWANIRMDGYPHLSRWVEAITSRAAFGQVMSEFIPLAKDSLASHRSGKPDDIDRLFGRGRHIRN